jgi:hypothetical protein
MAYGATSYGSYSQAMQVMDDTEAARALGWASIGIGLMEIAAPGKVEDLLGIEDSKEQRAILRVLGVRELGHGVSILTEDRPSKEMAASVWSRVAGDVLDSVLLGRAAMKTRRPLSFAMVAASVMAIGVADLLCAQKLSRRQEEESRGLAKRGMRWAGRMAGVAND